MAQSVGEPLLRIECSDGMAHTARVFYGDTEISALVRSISWSVDVEKQYATANIRFVIPAVNVTALTANDATTFTVCTPDGKEAIYSLAHGRLESIKEYY